VLISFCHPTKFQITYLSLTRQADFGASHAEWLWLPKTLSAYEINNLIIAIHRQPAIVPSHVFFPSSVAPKLMEF